MNNRIKELAEEAGMIIIDDEFSSYGKYTERFAELLVRECAELVDREISEGGVDGQMLKEHFGVE